MANKIKKFTDEDLVKLRSLIADIVLDNIYITGFMGSNFSVYDILHTLSVSSLTRTMETLKKKRASLEVENPWVENPNTEEIKKIDAQVDLVNLAIGYKLHLEELAQNEIERTRIQRQINELTEASKSPAELIRDLQQKLKELE